MPTKSKTTELDEEDQVDTLVENIRVDLVKELRVRIAQIPAGASNVEKARVCASFTHEYLMRIREVGQFQSVPQERLDQLHNYFTNIYRKLFERKQLKIQRIQALIDHCKREVLKSILVMITGSENRKDCITRMADIVDQYAAEFAENDDVLKGVPVGEVTKLKRYLKPIFKDQYDRFMSQYLVKIRENLLANQAELISVSNSPEDCIRRVEDAIDGFGKMMELQDLKVQLAPVFHSLYGDLKRTHIYDLIQLTKEAVMKDRDFIVIQSVSEEDCLARLSVSVDTKALEIIQQNSFLKAVPVGECNKLKRELKPIFKSRYHSRNEGMIVELKKQKLDEFICATRNAMLDRKHEIVVAKSTLEHCFETVEKETIAFAKGYIANSQFFRSVPEKKLAKLVRQLKVLFEEYYLISMSADGSDISSEHRGSELADKVKMVIQEEAQIPRKKSLTLDDSTSTFDQRDFTIKTEEIVKDDVMSLSVISRVENLIPHDMMTLPSDTRTFASDSEGEHYTAPERRSLSQKAPERIQGGTSIFADLASENGDGGSRNMGYVITGSFKIPFGAAPEDFTVELTVAHADHVSTDEDADEHGSGKFLLESDLHPDLVRAFLEEKFRVEAQRGKPQTTFIKAFE